MKKTKKMSVLTPVESAGRHYTRLGVDFIELIGFYEKYMSYLSDMAYVCHCLVTFPEYAGADFPPTRETVHKWAAEYDEYEKNNPESVCGTMEEEEAHRASHPTSGTIVPDDFGAKFFNANILEEIRNIDIRKGDSFMAVFTKCYFLHDRLASIYWNREYPVSTMEAANIIPFCGAVAEKTAELIGYWTAKRETRNPGAEKMKEKSAKNNEEIRKKLFEFKITTCQVFRADREKRTSFMNATQKATIDINHPKTLLSESTIIRKAGKILAERATI